MNHDFRGVFGLLHVDELLDGFIPLLPALLGVDLDNLTFITALKERFVFDYLH